VPQIHPKAIVSEQAKLADDVVVGAFSFIGDQVVIGPGCQVGNNVLIEGRTTIGKNCRIFTGAVVGTRPQDLKYNGEDTEVVMGNDNVIREYATINKGTSATGRTILGDGNLIMAYVHIAHDCQIQNNTILANSVTMAGHIVVEDYAIVGGLTPVHQFCRIGAHSIVGGISRINKDVPPYSKVAGIPTKVYGLNIIGLVRRNFSPEVIAELKRAFRFLFYGGYNTTQAIEEVRRQVKLVPEVEYLLNFISQSQRGILKGPRRMTDE